jgi:hypothetical protein
MSKRFNNPFRTGSSSAGKENDSTTTATAVAAVVAAAVVAAAAVVVVDDTDSKSKEEGHHDNSSSHNHQNNNNSNNKQTTQARTKSTTSLETPPPPPSPSPRSKKTTALSNSQRPRQRSLPSVDAATKSQNNKKKTMDDDDYYYNNEEENDNKNAGSHINNNNNKEEEGEGSPTTTASGGKISMRRGPLMGSAAAAAAAVGETTIITSTASFRLRKKKKDKEKSITKDKDKEKEKDKSIKPKKNKSTPDQNNSSSSSSNNKEKSQGGGRGGGGGETDKYRKSPFTAPAGTAFDDTDSDIWDEYDQYQRQLEQQEQQDKEEEEDEVLGSSSSSSGLGRNYLGAGTTVKGPGIKQNQQSQASPRRSVTAGMTEDSESGLEDTTTVGFDSDDDSKIYFEGEDDEDEEEADHKTASTPPPTTTMTRSSTPSSNKKLLKAVPSDDTATATLPALVAAAAVKKKKKTVASPKKRKKKKSVTDKDHPPASPLSPPSSSPPPCVVVEQQRLIEEENLKLSTSAIPFQEGHNKDGANKKDKEDNDTQPLAKNPPKRRNSSSALDGKKKSLRRKQQAIADAKLSKDDSARLLRSEDPSSSSSSGTNLKRRSIITMMMPTATATATTTNKEQEVEKSPVTKTTKMNVGKRIGTAGEGGKRGSSTSTSTSNTAAVEIGATINLKGWGKMSAILAKARADRVKQMAAAAAAAGTANADSDNHHPEGQELTPFSPMSEAKARVAASSSHKQKQTQRSLGLEAKLKELPSASARRRRGEDHEDDDASGQRSAITISNDEANCRPVSPLESPLLGPTTTSSPFSHKAKFRPSLQGWGVGMKKALMNPKMEHESYSTTASATRPPPPPPLSKPRTPKVQDVEISVDDEILQEAENVDWNLGARQDLYRVLGDDDFEADIQDDEKCVSGGRRMSKTRPSWDKFPDAFDAPMLDRGGAGDTRPTAKFNVVNVGVVDPGNTDDENDDHVKGDDEDSTEDILYVEDLAPYPMKKKSPLVEPATDRLKEMDAALRDTDARASFMASRGSGERPNSATTVLALERQTTAERNALVRERADLAFEREGLELQLEEERGKVDSLSNQMKELKDELEKYKLTSENMVPRDKGLVTSLKRQLEASDMAKSQLEEAKNVEIQDLLKVIKDLKESVGSEAAKAQSNGEKGKEEEREDTTVETSSNSPSFGLGQLGRLQGELLQARSKLADRDNRVSELQRESTELRNLLEQFESSTIVPSLKQQIATITREKEQLVKQLKNDQDLFHEKLKVKGETIEFMQSEIVKLKKKLDLDTSLHSVGDPLNNSTHSGHSTNPIARSFFGNSSASSISSMLKAKDARDLGKNVNLYESAAMASNTETGTGLFSMKWKK